MLQLELVVKLVQFALAELLGSINKFYHIKYTKVICCNNTSLFISLKNVGEL